MGYAEYDIVRRDGHTITAGYAIAATCERAGCGERINRGLDALCGETPGTPENGCGRYFCAQDLHIAPKGEAGYRCAECLAAPAYFPTPSVSRLVTEVGIAEALSGFAGDTLNSEFRATQRRTALLLRAVIADLFALAAPDNTRAALDAARAALAVRHHDRLPVRITTAEARRWLREEYTEWELDPPHHPHCPGGCNGSGTVLRVEIWQTDGVPLHQEPADCDRGEPEDPHPADCVCHGTGRMLDRYTPGEMVRCDGATTIDPSDPEPEPEHAYATPTGDPWSSESPF